MDVAVASAPGEGAPGEGAPSTGTVVSSVRWSVLLVVGRQVIRMLLLLVLARLLGPKNFGIVSLAGVFVVFTGLVVDHGLAAALVQKPTVTDADYATTMWANTLGALALAGLTVACAPVLAGFFHLPQLAGVLRLLSVSVALKGLTGGPIARLTRAFRFRRLAVIDVSTQLAGGAVGIAWALHHGGYWSLVAQTLTTDALAVVLLLACVGRQPVVPSLASLAGMWRYGANVVGFWSVIYVMRNADNLLVGRYLGPVQLAFYAVSYRVLMFSVQSFGTVVNRVAFPVYCRLQHDLPRARTQFRQSTRVVALVAAPVMTLGILVAPVAVPAVFGPSWRPAVFPMQLLALSGMRQSVQVLVDPVLQAQGRGAWQLRYGLLWSVVCVSAVAVGLRWGIVGVAAGYALSDAAISPVAVAMSCRALQFPVRDYLRDLAPAVLACLVLWAGFHAVYRLGELLRTGPVPASGAGVVLAALAALALLHWTCPARLRELAAVSRLMVRPS